MRTSKIECHLLGISGSIRRESANTAILRTLAEHLGTKASLSVSPLKNKPALLLASSPGYTGGARAHAQMRESLAAALARVVARPQVAIAGVTQKIVDGKLVDNATIKFCLDAIDDLISEIGSQSHVVAAAR